MVKFLDLHKINSRFENEFSSLFNNFLDSGHYIKGKQVENFETNFAKYCETTFCVGVANGLDALTLIFKAFIELGKINKGDEVIVPANTYIASILSIINSGLKPVFVEPNEATYNVSLVEIQKHITNKTKAILAVHLYGQLADMSVINSIAEEYNLLVVEDAAQAHGAIATDSNKRAGNLSDAAAFSFYPSKNLGALGDAGAITTNNSDVYNCIKLLHNYGSSEKYKNEKIGINSRLDELQAGFLNIKLKYLDQDNSIRQKIANSYLEGIKNPKIKLPFYDSSKNHVFHVFVVRVNDRDDFVTYLSANNIGYLIHYPIAPHKQKAFSNYNSLKLELTESIHKTVVSIPISPVMINSEVEEVINILNNY
jgi:dTDP-4-amino-4,6-dideoxygalactose transaminase